MRQTLDEQSLEDLREKARMLRQQAAGMSLRTDRETMLNQAASYEARAQAIQARLDAQQ